MKKYTFLLHYVFMTSYNSTQIHSSMVGHRNHKIETFEDIQDIQKKCIIHINNLNPDINAVNVRLLSFQLMNEEEVIDKNEQSINILSL
jgi:hypothetical protein